MINFTLFKHSLGLILLGFLAGGLMLLVTQNFWNKLRLYNTKERVAVSATVEKIRLSVEKEYNDSKRLIKTIYSLTFECVYSWNGKKNLYLKSGGQFLSLDLVIKKLQEFSPNQPIFIRDPNRFSQNEISSLSNLNLIAEKKGVCNLFISEREPELVLENTPEKLTVFILPIVLTSIILGISFFLLYRTFKSTSLVYFGILTLLTSLSFYTGYTLASQWFWKGGRNTSNYDSNKIEEFELFEIHKDADFSRWGF